MTQEKRYKEFVISHNDKDEILPQGSQIFIRWPNSLLKIKVGWSDVTYNGVLVAGQTIQTIGNGRLIRTPVQNEVKNMTQTWQDLVDNILDTWTTQNKSFTAYEVSAQVQKDLEQDGLDFVRHRDMRDYIHTEMNKTNSYQKVYHDFGTYKAFQYVPLPQSSVPQLSVSTTTTKSIRTPDKRGSITTPKKLVSQLGWSRGQTIYIINDHDGLHLTDQTQTQSKTTYTIDKNLNIRVTKKHLPFKTNYAVFIKDKEILVV